MGETILTIDSNTFIIISQISGTLVDYCGKPIKINHIKIKICRSEWLRCEKLNQKPRFLKLRDEQKRIKDVKM